MSDAPFRPAVGDDAPLPAPEVVDADRFVRAVRAIDAANAQDPQSVQLGGVRLPKELLHARLMSAWLERLDPHAGEAAHLAARAHHFRRWTRPRTDYPEGRAGYLRWRAAAKRAHALEVGELLAAEGYDDPEIERVASIVRKDGLGHDPVVQTHEDALCLVFLTTQLDDVAERLGDEQMVEILRRTIPKMSERGLAAAASLDLGSHGAELLARASSPAEDRSGS